MCALSRHRMRMLSLFKTLMRESEKFQEYSLRTYALRKVRDQFREHKTLTEAEKITEKVQYAQEMLQVIRRQVIIGHLFSTNKIAIEE